MTKTADTIFGLMIMILGSSTVSGLLPGQIGFGNTILIWAAFGAIVYWYSNLPDSTPKPTLEEIEESIKQHEARLESQREAAELFQRSR